MSSRSKNFRRRGGGDSDEDNGGNGNGSAGVVSTKASAVTPAKSSNRPKKTQHKLLSFAEDEDNESPFSRPQKSSSSRLSKPSSSHKVTSVKERLTPSSSFVPSNVQPSAGQYTKEALLELQKNTRTLGRSKRTPEPVIVLKGSLKPSKGLIEDDMLNGDLSSSKDDAERRLGTMAIGNEGGIPDQETISAIRAKKERLRQSRAAAPDYIALDTGSNHGEADGLSDEELELQTRIAMFAEKKDCPKKGVFEDVDEKLMSVVQPSLDNDDEDEEERKWEEEQVRKGLGKRMDKGSAGVGRNVQSVHSVEPQSYGVSYSCVAHVPAGSPTIGGAIGGLQGVGTVPISQQAKICRQALQDNINRLREVHGRTISSLSRANENLMASLSNITALENSSTAAGEKYIFLQKLRDFLSDICDFLQHKGPYIEELEEQMQQLHKKRASLVLERRAADKDDEMKEVQAAVDAAMTVLSRGGGSAATIAAARSAAEVAASSVEEQSNLPVKLDEFGRDLNKQKRLDIERRAKAREYRRNLSEKKRVAAVNNDNSYERVEGESSTDESDSETDAYKSNRSIILQTAEDVLGDTSEEYSQLSSVKQRFERWKRLYSGSYRDAYISLSIPSIFSLYVRLELLKWDPLYEEVDFYDMRWHSLLFDYGVPEDGSDFSPDDKDADLVPGLVEKIALPILHHDIEHCWDILSSRESKNAVAATSLIINYVPASSEGLEELIAVIRARLAEAVADLVVPAWSAVVMKAVPNAAKIAAYRFGMAVRLMRNICLWKDILAMPVLEKLVLDELLGGKVLPHVQNLIPDIHDAVTRTERIIASLSGVWTGPNVTSTRSHKLQRMVDYVLTLRKTLERRQAPGVPDSEISGLARRLKKMLVELNEYDEARSILRTFHLKEAL